VRTQIVFTNRRCNQHCAFCTERRAKDDLAAIAPAAVRAAIERAVQSGAEELVLTGGEPTLRGDLPALIAHAARPGVRVVLETNATLLDDVAAARLRDAGLHRARVQLSGWGAALDAVTADAGGFERTLRGLRALVAAGLELEVEAVVTRSTRALLIEMPTHLVEALPGARWHGLRIVVPVESPRSDELLSYAEAVPTVLALERAARRAGLPIKLSPRLAPPPCVFPVGARVDRLFALTAGGKDALGHVRIPACVRCSVADRCPGVPAANVARFGEPNAEPPADDRARRRLSLVADVRSQIERELVQANRFRAEDGRTVGESIIRVVFACNQDCSFCFVSTHLPGVDDARLMIEIERAGARGEKIVLSGGEPTLHPRLAQLVAASRAASPHPVQLQTNAMRFADRAYTQQLIDAGLTEAFVSLHGATAAVSDEVTRAPGTFVRTVDGIDSLVEHGVGVVLNFVVCATNLAELRAFVALVASRWPGVGVNFSFVAPSADVVPQTTQLVPRYATVMPLLHAAIGDAEAAGLPVRGLESMCGVPLCLVPSRYRGLDFAEVLAGEDRGEFVHVAACAACSLASRCFGVRRGYLALYGDAELSPVSGSAP